MSQHTSPFVFGAGAAQGQAAPAFPSQHQQNNSSSAPHLSTPSLPPAAQNAAFQQNAQLPGIDMSMLAGVSPDQFALIAQLLRSGALPLPPPPPLPSVSAPAVQDPAVTAPTDPSPPHVKAQQEDVDMDKEDGEVEEDEAVYNSPPSAAVDPPKVIPTGPRNASSPKSTRRDARSRQFAGSIPSRRLSTNRSATVASGTGIAIPYRAKEKQSQEFVLAMHQAGYSYRQLAEMVDNPQPLRRMFKLLGLPVSSDHGLSAAGQLSSQARPAQPPTVTSMSPTVDSAQKTSAAKPLAPPKPAAKADRSAYLAKLQALKAGKAGAVTTQPATPEPIQKAPIAEPSPSATTQQITVPSASPAATPAPTSKAVKTELARQRLEAFKAARAAKQQNQATGNGVPSVSSPIAPQSTARTTSAAPQGPPHNGLGAGLNGIAAVVGQQPSHIATQELAPPMTSQQMFSPTTPTPSRSVSGLPGLFMNGFRQQASPPAVPQPMRTVSQPDTEVASARQSALPMKRLMTTEYPNVPTQAKRPFGQSRSASEDESFIIENSDDEDDDDRMDIDTASARGNAPGQPSLNPLLLHDASSKPKLLHGSAPSTPGAATPGGMTYEQSVKAIEELNRRIAEKEAKNKAQGKAAVAKGDTPATASALPGISTPSRTASTVLTQEQVASAQAASADPARPASAAALKRKQEKEDLQKKLAALESARRQIALTALSVEDVTSNAKAAAKVSDVPPILMAATMKTPGQSSAAPVPVSAANVVEPSSEEGELEDESDFDFYGDEEPVNPVKPSDCQEHVGSQATTASAVTDVDVFPEESATPITNMPAHEDIGQDEEMAEGALLQASDVLPAEVTSEEVPETVLEAVNGLPGEAPGSIQAQPTPPDSDVNMDSESSGSEDSSDDGESDLEEPMEPADLDGGDKDDLNGPFEPAELEQGNGDMDPVRGPASVADIQNDAAATEGDQGVDDIESSDASSTGSSESEEYEPEPAEIQDDSSVVQPDDKVPDDDLAPELQPSEEEQTATAPTDQQPYTDGPKAYYTPYQSIMTKFKDYRYHPQYLNTVPSGFKSRTYNHQIDPMKQLCLTEAQGGTCHDKDCGGQHFDRMSISDNILLQQMGTKNIPARTKDEIEKWNVGLHEVIRTLKAADVRDAATIAARIAEYRREFVRDPSRVISMP